jgi:hypothetical protein
MLSTEHFKLCQGNHQLISNQGISLDKALEEKLTYLVADSTQKNTQKNC